MELPPPPFFFLCLFNFFIFVEKHKLEIRACFSLKDADLVGGELWDAVLRKFFIEMKALCAICIDASVSVCDCLAFLLVGGRDIWFEFDTNSQNAAYQWELEEEILQEGLGKAVGHKRYLTEPADV